MFCDSKYDSNKNELTDLKVIPCSNHLTEREANLRYAFTPPRQPSGVVMGTECIVRRNRNGFNIDSTNKKSNSAISFSQKFRSSANLVSDKSKTIRTCFIRKCWRKWIKKVSTALNTAIVCADFNNSRRSLSECDLIMLPVSPVPLTNKVPGVVGIQNHGNTCFINAVLQCLIQTDCLAEYFVTNQYKLDLARSKLISRKYKACGKVTEQLAFLLKSTWHCLYEPIISYQFKLTLGKFRAQYHGNSQQDALEFLIWLFEKVHEDLNFGTELNYKVNKNYLGLRDKELDKKPSANHYHSSHASFIQATFQGQFQSSLTCLNCKFQSTSFETFLHISVPIAHNQERPIYVIVLYTSQQQRQVMFGISLPENSKISDLRKQLSFVAGIPRSRILLTQINALGFRRTFSDHSPIREIKETEPIYCIEMPELKNTPEQAEQYILLCWINVMSTLDGHYSRFGSPYTMQLRRLTCYKDIQKLLLKEMNKILHDEALTEQHGLPFKIKIAENVSGERSNTSHLDPTTDYPLCADEVDQALALLDEDSGPKHLKLVLEWDVSSKESFVADDSNLIEEHLSARQLFINSKREDLVTLEECLRLFTKSEVLRKENKWLCSFCNKKQEAVKKLELWSLPDILIVHLKRFRHQSCKKGSAAKIMVPVEFPVYGLDMNPYLVESSRESTVSVGLQNYSSKPRKTFTYDENVYDLYGVCYHHGRNLYRGHYTALCRNPYDRQWYWFDDDKVLPMHESNVATAEAYLLFYQKRGLEYRDLSIRGTIQERRGLEGEDLSRRPLSMASVKLTPDSPFYMYTSRIRSS